MNIAGNIQGHGPSSHLLTNKYFSGGNSQFFNYFLLVKHIAIASESNLLSPTILFFFYFFLSWNQSNGPAFSDSFEACGVMWLNKPSIFPGPFLVSPGVIFAAQVSLTLVTNSQINFSLETMCKNFDLVVHIQLDPKFWE